MHIIKLEYDPMSTTNTYLDVSSDFWDETVHRKQLHVMLSSMWLFVQWTVRIMN